MENLRILIITLDVYNQNTLTVLVFSNFTTFIRNMI